MFVVPEEFQYDPVSKTYGDPTRRPEIKSSTIEFIAPSEYMVSCIITEL
jgi:Vesicle coat complex COPII, subunit SEC24/subunit SFB2/subunit SFB3